MSATFALDEAGGAEGITRVVGDGIRRRASATAITSTTRRLSSMPLRFICPDHHRSYASGQSSRLPPQNSKELLQRSFGDDYQLATGSRRGVPAWSWRSLNFRKNNPGCVRALPKRSIPHQDNAPKICCDGARVINKKRSGGFTTTRPEDKTISARTAVREPTNFLNAARLLRG